MKKVYTTPLAEVVETGTEEMICQSFSVGMDYNESNMEILENAVENNIFEDLW